LGRYLRIEFLAHYGNEFYCPVTLLRVHGTTMMEEYKKSRKFKARIEPRFAEKVPYCLIGKYYRPAGFKRSN
jgi:hypothetical protein